MPSSNITPLDYSTMTYVKPPPSSDEIRLIIRTEIENHRLRPVKIVGCIVDLIYLICIITFVGIIHYKVNEINANVIHLLNNSTST